MSKTFALLPRGPWRASTFYAIATVLNALDLVSSYIAFGMGLVELNAWASVFHSSYLACLASVLLYQLITTLLYYLTTKYRLLSPMFITWSLIKIYAVAWN
ncbi:MAG: hypothetical protein AT717_06130, partial [Vulcanisaeta sp. CIS_19]